VGQANELDRERPVVGADDGGGRVLGTVVDDDDAAPRREQLGSGLEIREQARKVELLVEGRYDVDDRGVDRRKRGGPGEWLRQNRLRRLDREIGRQRDLGRARFSSLLLRVSDVYRSPSSLRRGESRA
jgi:hypothetical protein